MSHLYELHRFVLYELPWAEGKNVLDLGCGKGIWGYLLRAEKKGDTAYMVGLDIYRPYLKFVKKHLVYDDLVLSDARNLPFRDGSFSITIASEIIEHLPKAFEDLFFKEIERVSTEKIVITTPNGSWYLAGPEAIESEIHRSAYTVIDFKKRAYRVHGLGFKFLKFYQAKKTSAQRLWVGLCFLFTPFSYTFPFLGEFLIAVKDVRQNSQKACSSDL